MSYQVFDPITGQHTLAATIEEAQEIRIGFITSFLDKNISMFSVAQVDTTEEGETWTAVEMPNDFTIRVL